MASRSIHVTFDVAQGVQVALSGRNPKGKQQARDAATAEQLLVSPWLTESPVRGSEEGAIRFIIVEGAREKEADVVVEGSVWNYLKDIINEVIEGGKVPQIAVKRVLAALDAVEAATEVKLAVVEKAAG